MASKDDIHFLSELRRRSKREAAAYPRRAVGDDRNGADRYRQAAPVSRHAPSLRSPGRAPKEYNCPAQNDGADHEAFRPDQANRREGT